MKRPSCTLPKKTGLPVLLALSSLLGPVYAGPETPLAPAEDAPSALSDWWNGKYLTGNWFGVRDTLADRGFRFGGKYEGIFFGVLDSQRGARGFYDQ
jgi:carbohydrate-selective porin OprB